MFFAAKIAVSALVIAGASELGKRSVGSAAILASLPINSIMTLTWVFFETKDLAKVGSLSFAIFWAAIPSLTMLLILPALLRKGLGYFPAVAASFAFTSLGYWVYVRVAGRFGIRF